MQKSKDACFSSKSATVNHVITLNGNHVEWVDEWVYLGVMLDGSKFHRCTYSVFRLNGHSKDAVVLKLVETQCIPIQTFVIEVIIVGNFTQYTVPFFERCFSTIGSKAALQVIS